MRRNGLDTAMYEISQVLKFSMRREHLEFSVSWRPPTEDELSAEPAELEPSCAVAGGETPAALPLLGQLRVDELLALAATSY